MPSPCFGELHDVVLEYIRVQASGLCKLRYVLCLAQLQIQLLIKEPGDVGHGGYGRLHDLVVMDLGSKVYRRLTSIS